MFLVVVVVLFPLVYLFNPRLSLVVLFAAIGGDVPSAVEIQRRLG